MLNRGQAPGMDVYMQYNFAIALKTY